MGNGQTKPSGVPGAPSRGKPLSSRHKPFVDTGKDATTPRAIYDGPRVETYAGGAQNVNAKISVQNRHDQDTSLVRCSGFDRTGQLASLTIAISSFGLQIVSTFIRTDADSSDVDDLFYVQTQRAGPVPEQQHAALVAHMERALGMAPSGEDNLITAAMNAGFIGGPGHHTSGGGYDEHKQSRAAFEKSYESNANGGGGGFFANNSGSSLFDPSTYASYGSVNHQTMDIGNVPHGPSVPDARFFEEPPPPPTEPLSYGESFEKHGIGERFASAPPPATPPSFDWNTSAGDSASSVSSDSGSAYDWTSSAEPVQQTPSHEVPSYDAQLKSSNSADPAAVLSARLRVAAAEMATAAAEFVQLERQRAETTDQRVMDALQQPRLEAQETLARTMASMQSMLKQRDSLRARMAGLPEEPEEPLIGAYLPPITARVEAPPLPAWPEARPYEAPAPRPYEPPTPRPYETWTPPERAPAPEFIPASSTFDLPSMDEGDQGYDPAPAPLDFDIPPPQTPMGTGQEIMLQGFNWESCNSHKKWFNVISDEAGEIANAGFTAVWLPPPTDSVSDQGYLPRDLYNLNSFYGNVEDLKRCVNAMKQNGVCPVADIVINHRCADKQGEDGRWNLFTGKMAWDQQAITTDNPEFGGRGCGGTGEDYGPAPNVDHTKDWVRNDLKQWLHWMKNDIGFGGWRFDFVKGYGGNFTGEYVGDTKPYVSVGEHWVACNYNGGNLEYNQDSHRQSTFDWCASTGGSTAAFDFTTKGILQEALRNREYWRLQGSDGHPAGFCGKWPTHAVTFIENHDTGSTLQHWPFPVDRLAEGYAYILTHPGTPTVFYDHWKDPELREDIQSLMEVRKRLKIGCDAAVYITKAEDGCYAARIGQPRQIVDRQACSEVDGSKPSLCVKLGPGDWSPNRERVGGTKWTCKASGDGWAVWEDRRFLD